METRETEGEEEEEAREVREVEEEEDLEGEKDEDDEEEEDGCMLVDMGVEPDASILSVAADEGGGIGVEAAATDDVDGSNDSVGAPFVGADKKVGSEDESGRVCEVEEKSISSGRRGEGGEMTGWRVEDDDEDGMVGSVT